MRGARRVLVVLMLKLEMLQGAVVFRARSTSGTSRGYNVRGWENIPTVKETGKKLPEGT